MTDTSPCARSLKNEFVVLSPDKRASIEKADAGLYQRLDETYGDFAGHELIALYQFESDWPTWEIHPHGDELVVLMSGEITFVFHLDDGESSLRLTEPGSYAIVPRNTWHTARTDTPCSVLFVTPGQGTQNAEEPPPSNSE